MPDMKIVLKDKTELSIDGLNFPANIIKTCKSKDEVMNVWGFLTNDNMEEMHVYEDGVESIVMKGYTLDGVQATVNPDGTVAAHFYLRDGQYASVITDAVAEAEKEEILALVTKYGGFRTQVVQSDKIGFDWREEYIGDVLLNRTYVGQENPVGTKENPIEYYEGLPLINGAYYMKDGTRQVYMDEEWAEF